MIKNSQVRSRRRISALCGVALFSNLMITERCLCWDPIGVVAQWNSDTFVISKLEVGKVNDSVTLSARPLRQSGGDNKAVPLSILDRKEVEALSWGNSGQYFASLVVDRNPYFGGIEFSSIIVLAPVKSLKRNDSSNIVSDNGIGLVKIPHREKAASEDKEMVSATLEGLGNVCHDELREVLGGGYVGNVKPLDLFMVRLGNKGRKLIPDYAIGVESQYRVFLRVQCDRCVQLWEGSVDQRTAKHLCGSKFAGIGTTEISWCRLYSGMTRAVGSVHIFIADEKIISVSENGILEVFTVKSRVVELKSNVQVTPPVGIGFDGKAVYGLYKGEDASFSYRILCGVGSVAIDHLDREFVGSPKTLEESMLSLACDQM